MVLDTPPYLQIALDMINHEQLEEILDAIPSSKKIILEAGTPLIKKFGINVIQTIHNIHPNNYIVADMKTLDVAELEVFIAAEARADAIAISGLASLETINKGIISGKEHGMDVFLDLMNVSDPEALLENLEDLPAVMLFHRGIDQEGNLDHPWEKIKEIKQKYSNVLVAVAGGINVMTADKALSNGADIVVVGRAITTAENTTQAVYDFLTLL